MLKPILVLLVASLTIVACSKSGKQAAPPTFTPGYNVYMAGTSQGRVVYWKNGTKIDLGSFGEAQTIAINGSDLYIGGYIVDSANTEAAYWKNGQLVQLEGQGISHVFGMALNGTDVYCVGDLFGPYQSGRDSATIWKNGQRTHLSTSSNGLCRFILFSGPDIYVTGQVWAQSLLPGEDSGVLWKNGIITTYTTPGDIYSLAILQSDTIIIGRSGAQSFIISNNTYQPLINRYLQALTTSGSDIYTAGGIDSNGVYSVAYWKNSTLNVLNCPYNSPSVSGIAIAGPDVYVAGSAYDTAVGQIPFYWKNGNPVSLGGSGAVYAIAAGK